MKLIEMITNFRKKGNPVCMEKNATGKILHTRKNSVTPVMRILLQLAIPNLKRMMESLQMVELLIGQNANMAQLATGKISSIREISSTPSLHSSLLVHKQVSTFISL